MISWVVVYVNPQSGNFRTGQPCLYAHFDSSLFCNFIYRDRRQSSPLPQQIKPEAGKGHPIQSSDLLHIFLSVSLGGVAYRRRSGVILFLQHGAAMPAPFLMTVPFFFLPSEKQKRPDSSEHLLLQKNPAC